MATETGVTAAHGTLTAATVETVTLSAPMAEFEVVNRGDTVMYYVAGTAAFMAGAAAPTVAGDDTKAVPPGASRIDRASGRGGPTVKIISAGTSPYSVQKVS